MCPIMRTFLSVVPATSGRLTGGTAEDKERPKAAAVNLDFGDYFLSL